MWEADAGRTHTAARCTPTPTPLVWNVPDRVPVLSLLPRRPRPSPVIGSLRTPGSPLVLNGEGSGTRLWGSVPHVCSSESGARPTACPGPLAAPFRCQWGAAGPQKAEARVLL